MITLEQAKRAANEKIGPQCRLLEQLTWEMPNGWHFVYESKETLRMGNRRCGFGAGGDVFVEKETGRICDVGKAYRANPRKHSSIPFARKLDIIESDLGRRDGWFVEQNGERIAALVDVQFPEMFWDSYRVEILTTNPDQEAKMFTQDFWNSEDLVFRDREFGEIAEGAMPAVCAAQTMCDEGRIWMRWLRLPVTCEPWHWVAIKLRRLYRKMR
jgi:hypothetical protein